MVSGALAAHAARDPAAMRWLYSPCCLRSTQSGRVSEISHQQQGPYIPTVLPKEAYTTASGSHANCCRRSLTEMYCFSFALTCR